MAEKTMHDTSQLEDAISDGAMSHVAITAERQKHIRRKVSVLDACLRAVILTPTPVRQACASDRLHPLRSIISGPRQHRQCKDGWAPG